MTDYSKDRNFGDKFIEQAKYILADCFYADPDSGLAKITTASDELDHKRATDIVMDGNGKDYHVAFRVRTSNYAKYNTEFTLRYSRESGAKTEVEKIMEGNADFLMYCFADKSNMFIEYYTIIDLERFRAYYRKHGFHIMTKTNLDGTAFKIVNINALRRFDPEALLHTNIPQLSK